MEHKELSQQTTLSSQDPLEPSPSPPSFLLPSLPSTHISVLELSHMATTGTPMWAEAMRLGSSLLQKEAPALLPAGLLLRASWLCFFLDSASFHIYSSSDGQQGCSCSRHLIIKLQGRFSCHTPPPLGARKCSVASRITASKMSLSESPEPVNMSCCSTNGWRWGRGRWKETSNQLL